MSAHQGSKKKGRTLDGNVRRLNQRLAVLEAIVGRLLERENLVIGMQRGGGLMLLDAATVQQPRESEMEVREIPENEPAGPNAHGLGPDTDGGANPDYVGEETDAPATA